MLLVRRYSSQVLMVSFLMALSVSAYGDTYSDDFSVDSRSQYNVVNTWTQGGVGQLLYDSTVKRLQVKTGDNIGLAFSRSLPGASAEGVYGMDFLPKVKYPAGGEIILRLKQDASNYYSIRNSDGFGPGEVEKVVGGQVVEQVRFISGYSQNVGYRIEVTFSPQSILVEAFGNQVVLERDSTALIVNRFEVELRQQTGYIDRISYNGAAGGGDFSDDFSIDSRGQYVVENTWTQGGVGQLLYDSAVKRLQVNTGDNIGLAFSRSLPGAFTEGVYGMDFLPKVKYPTGGEVILRLEQDASNYYQIRNTDGYGAGEVEKVVGSQVVEQARFGSAYSQNTNYRIEVTFSPGAVLVEAFGSQVVLEQNSTVLVVKRFEVELRQQRGYIDNIFFSADGPYLRLLSPINYYLQQTDDLSVSAFATASSQVSGVKFVLREDDQNNPVTIGQYVDQTKPYGHIFYNLKKGEYAVEATLIDSNGQEIQNQFAIDIAAPVGIGDYYVAVGDSITAAGSDGLASDNVSLDGRNKGGGYPPILNNKLTSFRGYPHTVVNEGINGERSGDGLARISSVLDRHPRSKYILILYGTNDSGGSRPPVPSGLDPNGNLLSPSDPLYASTFLDNMQQIINKIKSRGKMPVLAKVPILFGECSYCEKFPNPDTASRNLRIQQYNRVIDGLVIRNNLPDVPPDFYNYYRSHPEEFADNLHPSGIGYQSMSRLWFNSLTQ